MTLAFLMTVSIVVALTYLGCVALAAIASALSAGGRYQDPVASREALSVSRFTIPVSVITPVTVDSPSVSPTIAALLALNYPEFEVIVVADGLPSPTIESLAREWALEAKEFFYRRKLDTAEVHRIHRSTRDPRLVVIHKAAGGYGDALNCGVNVARYRYVMSIAPGVVFDADALLRIMSAALHDPANVVGASSHVERASLRATDRSLQAGPPFLGRTGELFQRLGSLRSLMDSRLAWRHLRLGLGPAGAVAVWRRDAVLTLQGFSSTAADPDLDMMFRLQTANAEGSSRFERGGDVFGRASAQSLRGELGSARRRQVATLQLLRTWARGGTGRFDPGTLTYFIATELMTPLAQIWVVVATVAGAAMGWFGWSVPALALVVLSFGHAAVTIAALFLRGARPDAPEGTELRRLILASPVEFVLYRSALAGARLAALLKI